MSRRPIDVRYVLAVIGVLCLGMAGYGLVKSAGVPRQEPTERAAHSDHASSPVAKADQEDLPSSSDPFGTPMSVVAIVGISCLLLTPGIPGPPPDAN